MTRTVLGFVAIMLAVTGPASAHAFLEHSNPGAGAVLTAAPKILTLDFTEELEPSFSTATVSDASGHPVTSAAADISGTRISLTLPDLKPGKYRVTWHAVSVDTHRTQGSFAFTVKR